MITEPLDTLPLSTTNTHLLVQLEKTMLARRLDIEAWFRSEWQRTPPSLYSSIDLRNAGFKLAPVDTNLFPAGFNNLNPDFYALAVQAAQATITEICPDVTRLLLVPESHTRNQMYFESLAVLHNILTGAGFEVRIGSPNPEIKEPQNITTPSGQQITLEPLIKQEDRAGVADYFPCCIILNNDLSDGIPDALQNLNEQTIMPCTQLGWFARLKSEHFDQYRQVCHEIAQLIDIDPWLISPLFDHCNEIDFMKHQGEGCLARRAEKLLFQIQQKYDEYAIQEKPYLVVKSNAGTYGMAVMVIQEAEQLMGLNRKQRTKMAASKGSQEVTSAIIQEGVYSFETWGTEQAVSEPVIYAFGRHVIGGFYRIHTGRGPSDSLNAPGMNFQPLAFSNPCNSPQTRESKPNNRFYIYGVIARLASLAAARELHALNCC